MYAFQITEEDIQQALLNKDIILNDKEICDFYGEINFDLVEKSALMAEDMDKQIEYAYEEIFEQYKLTR
jgi:hypothetical protein